MMRAKKAGQSIEFEFSSKIIDHFLAIIQSHLFLGKMHLPSDDNYRVNVVYICSGVRHDHIVFIMNPNPY
jgi:hypothetical protein